MRAHTHIYVLFESKAARCQYEYVCWSTYVRAFKKKLTLIPRVFVSCRY